MFNSFNIYGTREIEILKPTQRFNSVVKNAKCDKVLSVFNLHYTLRWFFNIQFELLKYFKMDS